MLFCRSAMKNCGPKYRRSWELPKHVATLIMVCGKSIFGGFSQVTLYVWQFKLTPRMNCYWLLIHLVVITAVMWERTCYIATDDLCVIGTCTSMRKSTTLVRILTSGMTPLMAMRRPVVVRRSVPSTALASHTTINSTMCLVCSWTYYC